MLDVRRLRLLRELHIRGTLAAVADHLGQSPSAVSQQITRLERDVGMPLLRKVGRGVQLTPAALRLVAHTEAVMDRLEQAEADLERSRTEAIGTVRIAVFQSAALALLPRTLLLLRDRHPGLRVTVTQREPETALHETWHRDFDLVVAEQYPAHSAPWLRGLDRVALTDDEIRLAVSATDPRWADVSGIADVADAPWVAETPGVASRHFAEQTCRLAGFDPDVRFETADLQAQIKLVESGNAVALLPNLLWLDQEPPVRLVPLAGRPRRAIFTSARAAAARTPAVVACRAALAEVVASS